MVFDAVIVGAGAAGLAAAAELARSDARVAVVEGRDRVGGRIRTLRDSRAPVAVELGAEFVHGRAPLTRRLLSAGGVGTIPMEGEAWLGEGGRMLPGDSAWEGIGRVLGALESDRVPDRSFADFLRSDGGRFSPADSAAARAFVEGFHASDAERISERSLAGEGTHAASDSGRLPEGYDTLVREVAARVAPEVIALGRTVRRISWWRGRVELETVASADGVPVEPLMARAVVVTVPVGVLKRPNTPASIRFEPPIAALADALDGLAMGSALRVSLAFERDLWGERPLLPTPEGVPAPPSFIHTPARGFNAYWTAEPASAPFLVAWAGGSRSRALPGDVASLADLALTELAEATGAELTPLREGLRAAWCHDWRSDVYSLGAYPYVTVGGMEAPDRLGRPVEDTVFFAGDATAAETIGTVEGALASGRRAAEQVLKALGS